MYYPISDRNVRTKNAKVHLKDHLQQKGKLDKQERVLRSKYDRVSYLLCEIVKKFLQCNISKFAISD